MFQMAYGSSPATAHDVFMGLQEIPYLMKINKCPESKLLLAEENMARVLHIRWSDVDLAKAQCAYYAQILADWNEEKLAY